MSDSDQPQRKFLSLKLKWALGTALGSLVIFLVVAFVFLMAFQQQLMGQERQRTNNALLIVTDRLNYKQSRLTARSVNRDLQLHRALHGIPGSQFHESIAQGLGDSHLIINIYDHAGHRLFGTWRSSAPLKAVRHRSLTMGRRKGASQMITGREPIRARNHHQIIGYVQVENHLSAYANAMTHIWHVFFLALALVVLASALLGYFLSAMFLRPLDDVADTIEQVSNDPTTKARVPAMKANDEIAELGRVANQMIDQTQDYIDSQMQFVNDVSHELRTPITIIHGHLEMLQRWGKDDPDILNESLKESLAEVTRLNNLIKEMIELTRAEEAPINFRDETTDVRSVVHQIFQSYQEMYPKFMFIMDDDLHDQLNVNILRDHLVEILTILCDNAVKYSADRREVHLALSRNMTQVEIAVQDFGIGIPSDDIPRVFNRFYRVDKARNRKKGGNGLGLAIAKKLVDGYGGTISVESSVGAGSVFRVTLPLVDEGTKPNRHKAGQTDLPSGYNIR